MTDTCKKKILILSHAMEIGGAERALLGLLEQLDTARYDVDLFLLRHRGELLPLIPEKIRLLPEVPAYSVLARPMTQTLKEGHIRLTAARLRGRRAAEKYVQAHDLGENDVAIEYSHKFTKDLMPPIQPDTEYDLAISFLTPHYFVAEKVCAKRKAAWIHTDYSTVQVDADSQEKMWSPYDYIVSISEEVTKSFVGVFPSLRERIVLIENILPVSLIRRQAGEPVGADFAGAPAAGQTAGTDLSTVPQAEGTYQPADPRAEGKDLPAAGCGESRTWKILSIGRFSPPKNFDNVPDICSRILTEGISVRWYLIGYGGDEELIRRRIKEAGMEEHVILLGKKENPYPYIRACDLYAQPSRYEGKSVCVREAQLLGKPVVITDYPTAKSQLEDGADGVIVPLDNAGCAKGIAALLKDPARMVQLAHTCRQRDYTNGDQVKKVYRLIEG